AQSVARRVEDDEELSVAPAFFETLWQENASIARVELRAKDGVLDNEMNKFRYDVVLHVGDGDRAVRVAPDVAAFERDMGGKSAREQSLAAWMADADGPATLGELLDGSAHDAVPARDAKTRGRSGGAAGRPYSDPLRRRRRHARADELRRRLATDLPAHLTPDAIVVLDRLPLTPNGKVDRGALREVDRRGSAGTYVAPRNDLEATLATLWGELLDRDRVGVQDDFFAIGGHSLLATRVVARVRERTGVDLPVRLLFEAKTIEGLAQAMASLDGGGEAAPPLRRYPAAGDVPLSFAQRRLWLLEQLLPSTHNMPAAVCLSGPLSVVALERAVSGVVARHDALRTTFQTRGADVVQVVSAPGKVDVPGIDWAPGDDSDAARAAWIEAFARRPFDLARAPLWRVVLLRPTTPGEHVLALCVHHAICDAWSLGILVNEIGRLYEANLRALETGSDVEEIPPLGLQYGDYTLWQRELLTGANRERLVAHWKEKLSGAPPFLDWPTDRPRPSVQGSAGAAHRIVLGRNLLRELEHLARDCGATLHMVLLAAIGVLLHRRTGQKDLVVGSPVATRSRPQLEQLIGCFLNPLPLRILVDREASVRALIARVKQVALDAYEHQDLPFEQIVEAVAPARDQSRGPLFQIVFALQNAPTAELVLRSLRLHWMNLGVHAAKNDLWIGVDQSSDELAATFEYNADLFDRETIVQFARQFERVLRAAVSDPGIRVGSIPLITDAERSSIVALGRGPSHDARPLPCVHECVAAQAAATPEAIAVSDPDETITYAELDRRATRVAIGLTTLGIGLESRVGVALPRSVPAVIAILGVMKAGAAYVPLDLAYPPERLSFILLDADVDVIVTSP